MPNAWGSTTTFDVTSPNRFSKIDEISRPDHFWLTDDDRCYFLGDYTARQDYGHSATNQLIWNFKKTLDRRGRPEWRYKEPAIRQAAARFREALGEEPPPWVFVPVPPSKARTDPLHDDRITRMLRAIWPNRSPDVREMIVQSESTETAHGSDDRPTPDEIERRYRIDHSLTTPEPAVIAIVDDVLTTGAHFRAASAILAAQFPDAQILGLFLARRAPEADLPF